MKHYFTFGKLNINSKDPIIPRINQIKSKKLLLEIKHYNNNINTISIKELINRKIKKFNSLSLKVKNRRNILNYTNKYKNKTHSYSSKIIQNYSRKIKNGISKESSKTKENNKYKNSYNDLYYIENLKKKIKNKNRNIFDIFYNKENILLMKSFNTLNNQIRKNINKKILYLNNPLNNNIQLNEKSINNNNCIIKNNIKNLLKNNIDNNIIKKMKKEKDILKLNKIYIENRNERNLSNMTIKNKKPFNSINSRICFPYFFKDNMIMDNYSNKNILEYKKYIQTQ